MTTAMTYMVQTFNRSEHGPVTDGQVRCRSAAEAIRTGAALVPAKVSAVALETTSEHLTVQHVRILGQWGEVPESFLTGLRSGGASQGFSIESTRAILTTSHAGSTRPCVVRPGRGTGNSLLPGRFKRRAT